MVGWWQRGTYTHFVDGRARMPKSEKVNKKKLLKFATRSLDCEKNHIMSSFNETPFGIIRTQDEGSLHYAAECPMFR